MRIKFLQLRKTHTVFSRDCTGRKLLTDCQTNECVLGPLIPSLKEQLTILQYLFQGIGQTNIGFYHIQWDYGAIGIPTISFLLTLLTTPTYCLPP